MEHRGEVGLPRKEHVVAAIGDGSFMMTSCELETARRVGAPFVSVIFNDGMYGLIKLKADAAFGKSNGVVCFTNPDIVQYASSFGVAGRRAGSVQELEELIRTGIKDYRDHRHRRPDRSRENTKLSLG